MWNKSCYHFILTTVLSLFATTIFGQTDSLITTKGNVIVGEIKSLNNGVLVIETDYSKNDFDVEWSGLKEVYSNSRFLITLKDGRRFNGHFRSIGAEKLEIIDLEGDKIDVSLYDLVFLKGLDATFWSRLYATIDLGLNITRANNFRQFSMRSTLGFLADKWSLDTYFNNIHSDQDDIDPTKRTEGGINYKFYLQHDWFLMADLAFLSNTEQALKLRTNGKLGAGRYLIHTNKAYWGAGGGLSYNNETFTNETETRNSAELYAGTELNLFDIGDLDLLSTLYVYRSLTEKDRWRSDFKIDAKYDLPLDFYLKTGITMNYDNRPAIAGNETDYVFVFSFGWEFK